MPSTATFCDVNKTTTKNFQVSNNFRKYFTKKFTKDFVKIMKVRKRLITNFNFLLWQLLDSHVNGTGNSFSQKLLSNTRLLMPIAKRVIEVWCVW